MIFQGIIQSMGNSTESPRTCKVKIPAFSPAGSSACVLSADIMIFPGITVDYNKNDDVYVAFIENDYRNPIVLGKCYRSLNNELKNVNNKNNLTTNTLTVKADASINNLVISGGITLTQAGLANFGTSMFNSLAGNLNNLSAMQATNNFSNAKQQIQSKKLADNNELIIYDPVEIGTFEQRDVNTKAPQKYRQEFKITFKNQPTTFPYILQISFLDTMPKSLTMAKIDSVNTFLLTDKYTLNPGIYLYDETGQALTTQQIFEVKTDLKNRKFTICISGKTGTEQFNTLYLTTEYA